MSDAIHGKLEDVRRKLLDLTRRNRLLNHRDSGRRTLEIAAGESGRTAWERLVVAGKPMQFLERQEHPGPEPVDLPPEAVIAENEGMPPVPIAPEPGADPDDDALETTLDAEKLQKRLVVLAREARTAQQEQGANLLYATIGMVEWREEAGERACRAPLLFVPAELHRRGVNTRYALRASGDDPMVNPCLVELCRRQFDFELPEPREDEPYAAYAERVAAALPGPLGWSLDADALRVGLFSFAKLLMWRDLDPAGWPGGGQVGDHPLIRRLLGEEPLGDGDDAGMPDPRSLDDDVPPAENFQVMDADSSQQSAIVAAKRGVSMVIDGPPGTGKSQTITNVIAELLGAGKTVLFVAEKAAALEVVQRRLSKVGLGDFVLPLHSHRTSKRQVLEELGRCLSLPPARELRDPDDGSALAEARSRLNGYARALHEPVGGLAMSVYDAIGRLVALREMPEARADVPRVLDWTPAELARARETLRTIDARLERVGTVAENPWRGIGLTDAPLALRQQIGDAANALVEAVETQQAAAATLAATLEQEPPATVGSAADQRRAARRLLAVEVPPAAMTDRRWDTLPADADALLGHLALRGEWVGQWSPHFAATAEAEGWSGVLARRRQHGESFTRLFRPSWYRDSGKLKRHARSGLPPMPEQIKALAALEESRRVRAQIDEDLAKLDGLPGFRFPGLDQADPAALRDGWEKIVAARQAVLTGAVSEHAAELAMTADGRRTLLTHADAARRSADDLEARLSDLLGLLEAEATGWLGGEWAGQAYEPLKERVADLPAYMEELRDMADLNAAKRSAAEQPVAAFVGWALAQPAIVTRGRMDRVFDRHFLRLWLDAAVGERPALRGFRGEEFEQLAGRFRRLDVEWLAKSRQRLRSIISRRRPSAVGDAHKSSKLGILQAEARKKTRHMPLRRLLSTCGEVIQDLKPCFMMSPISVAQYLDPAAAAFDVVIFDEASQIEPADALGCMARGKQVLLVGDEKQLPPTSFFDKFEEETWAEEGEEDVRAGDLESVLSLGVVRLPHRCGLRWHYRSRHASLIQFSNEQFYDRSLKVFPSPHTDRSRLGVTKVHVEGKYARGSGRDNDAEAEEVAAAVMEHARTRPGLTLGVAALNMPQQQLIADKVEAARRAETDPAVEAFFDAHEDEPFFVKNLENVQGDERDVIFISVGYGRDEAGKLTMNFGPLNAEGGWRRLNVLVTRAKRRCVVFSGLRAEDFPDDLAAPGVAALRDYLRYAEHGPAVRDEAEDAAATLPGDVRRSLEARGWAVRPGVGDEGFDVDLGVVDPDDPAKYLLGIACDGPAYAACPTARDRERTRPAVLGGLGWSLARVWSPDWMHDPETVAESLHEAAAAAQAGREEDAAVPDVEDVVVKTAEPDEDSGDGTVVYEWRRSLLKGGLSKLKRLGPGSLDDVVGVILRAEAPIHEDEACRALADRYDTRVTTTVRRQLAAGLAALGAAYERRGGFIYPAGWEPMVRRRDVDGCPVTRPGLIPPEEWEAAVRLTVERQYGVPADDLAAAAGRTLGLARATDEARAQADAAAERLREAGRVTLDDEKTWVATAPATSR